MNPNPAFRQETQEHNIAFIRERSFGTLAINADGGPLLSHIPFLLSQDSKHIELHLVRSNPIIRELQEAKPAVISLTGGDTYVSPDWYFVDDQVPTWNYIAVHIRGRISLLPDDDLHGVLNRLSASMEERLLPKKPWKSSKMDENVYNRMLRQIVPLKMEVAEITGTWKLSQNKPGEVRLNAAKGIAEHGMGTQLELISSLMKNASS